MAGSGFSYYGVGSSNLGLLGNLIPNTIDVDSGNTVGPGIYQILQVNTLYRCSYSVNHYDPNSFIAGISVYFNCGVDGDWVAIEDSQGYGVHILGGLYPNPSNLTTIGGGNNNGSGKTAYFHKNHGSWRLAFIVGNQLSDYGIVDALRFSDLVTKADLVGGKVPASQLPSYVDDVLEFDNIALFPSLGASSIIYVDKSSNKTYRWSGSSYVGLDIDAFLNERIYVYDEEGSFTIGKVNFITTSTPALSINRSLPPITSNDFNKVILIHSNTDKIVYISGAFDASGFERPITLNRQNQKVFLIALQYSGWVLISEDLNYTPENSAYKTSVISAGDTVHYPNSKAVVDYITSLNLGNSGGSGIVNPVMENFPNALISGQLANYQGTYSVKFMPKYNITVKKMKCLVTQPNASDTFYLDIYNLANARLDGGSFVPNTAGYFGVNMNIALTGGVFYWLSIRSVFGSANFATAACYSHAEIANSASNQGGGASPTTRAVGSLAPICPYFLLFG